MVGSVDTFSNSSRRLLTLSLAPSTNRWSTWKIIRK